MQTKSRKGDGGGNAALRDRGKMEQREGGGTTGVGRGNIWIDRGVEETREREEGSTSLPTKQRAPQHRT